MRINFICPWYNSDKPSGGILNIYWYSIYLAKRGHKVQIIYDCLVNIGKFPPINLLRYNKRKSNTKANPRFKSIFDKYSIQEKTVAMASNLNIPDADIIIATALATTFNVRKLSKSKGIKYYFIQGFENWGVTNNKVYETYGFGFTNIAVSKWLYKMVCEHAKSKTYYLPNAISDDLYIENPIESRKSNTILFMYVPIESKGTYDVIKALKIVRKSIDVNVKAFGIYQDPTDLPDWVEYNYNPNRDQLRNIYNEAAIFVTGSWIEGFGLTVAEAMKCGCAVCTTNSKGVRDVAIQNETALISSIKSPEELANNIVFLVNDRRKRVELAKNGSEYIKKFSWDENIDKIESIFEENA